MSLRILLTGFETFDGAPHNPSGDVALALNGETVGSMSEPGARNGTIRGVRLPVLWRGATKAVVHEIETYAPHIVISLGMAKHAFRVEQVASDRRIDRPDNAGVSFGFETARSHLPTALPRAEIERSLIASVGLDHVAESADAGGYICEEVFFAVMNAHAEAKPRARILRAGFIHTPNDTVVPKVISAEAVEIAIRRAVSVTLDDLTEDEYLSV